MVLHRDRLPGHRQDQADDELRLAEGRAPTTTEYERVVVHEFGHALGAIHEHQNPKGGIEWNLPAVYKYFAGPPNFWSKEDVDVNVLGSTRSIS